MAAPSQGRSSGLSGRSSGAAIQLRGAREMRRALRTLENPRTWTKELAKAHRQVGRLVAEKARAEAQRGDSRLSVPHNKMLEHFAKRISGKGTVSGARVGLIGRKPESAAAFWGAKGRSGWYLNQSLKTRRLDSSGRVNVDYRLRSGGTGQPQFARWVGNDWDSASTTQGPYAINPALAKNMPEVEAKFQVVIDDLLKRAFPGHTFGGS